MKTYNVEKFIGTGAGRWGHWYICRQIRAKSLSEAKLLAFSDGIPEGYRVREI